MSPATENRVVSNARPHPWRRWAATLGLGIISLVVLLAVAGLVYQWAATRIDERRYPMPGVLVEVDGHRMHLDCRGAGSPTVVMDAGLGDSSVTWALVQPEVATFTRACSYDRPGYGWSDGANVPRDSQAVARQLHALLAGAGIPGPYLLVGHSFGGLNQLVFHSLYPSEVAGMVLVDSSHPGQLERLAPDVSIEADEASTQLSAAGRMARTGPAAGMVSRRLHLSPRRRSLAEGRTGGDRRGLPDGRFSRYAERGAGFPPEHAPSSGVRIARSVAARRPLARSARRHRLSTGGSRSG